MKKAREKQERWKKERREEVERKRGELLSRAPLLPILLATELFSVARERQSRRKRGSEEKEEEGRERREGEREGRRGAKSGGREKERGKRRERERERRVRKFPSLASPRDGKISSDYIFFIFIFNVFK